MRGSDGYWVWVLCLDPDLKPIPKTDSEFNSIHFGIEIDKCL